jgi:hypothetical protein
VQKQIQVSVNLSDGLGNQLFQLGFLHFIAQLLDAKPVICFLKGRSSKHSNKNYFNSIFKHFFHLYKPKIGVNIKENQKMEIENWIERIQREGKNPLYNFHGFFQQWIYMDGIRDSFIKQLDFSAQEYLLEKYPVQDKVFVHIRGGDFLQIKNHQVDLKNYYKTCESLQRSQQFVLFTNDEPYATKFLHDNQLFQGSTFIHEDEISVLYLMSKCKACICANSTFSWWGAYLNTNRTIYLPSLYFDPNYCDSAANYHFPEAIIIEV